MVRSVTMFEQLVYSVTMFETIGLQRQCLKQMVDNVTPLGKSKVAVGVLVVRVALVALAVVVD